MLTSELASVLQDILNNYSIINLDRLTTAATSALVRRDDPTQYAALRNNAVNEIERALTKLNQRLDSARIKKLISNSDYPDMLPRDVLERLLRLLDVNPTIAGVSSESNAIKSRTSNAINAAGSFIATAAAFKQTDFAISSDMISFYLSIPQTLVGDSFGAFKDKIDTYENFFRLAADYILNTNDHVLLKHVAMSDPTLFFETAKEYAAILVPLWNYILEFAISTIKQKSAIMAILTGGAGEDHLEPIKKSMEDNSLKNMMEGIEAISKAHATDPHRSQEVKGKFENSCKMVCNDVAHGTTLEILSKAEFTILTIAVGDEAQKAEITKALEDKRALQNELASLRKETAPVLLPRLDA